MRNRNFQRHKSIQKSKKRAHAITFEQVRSQGSEIHPPEVGRITVKWGTDEYQLKDR